MSTPYPPQPRRLMRDPSNKLIGGVCSGVAKYLNMDVNLVRILTVLISLFTGIPIVLYLIALFVMPEERNEPQPPYVNGPQPGAYGAGYSGQAYQQPTYGTPPAAQPADEVWGSSGAPWEQPQTAAPSAAPSAAQSSWQQPPSAAAGDGGGSGAGEEPTRYDTAPVSDDAPETPVPDAPATAAPEKQPEGLPKPDPTPESEAPQPAPEQTSVWESAPADPDAESPEQTSEPSGSDTDRSEDRQG